MATSVSFENLPHLSVGSITRMLNEELVDRAILQILGYKRVPGSNSNRFRLLLNDGETLFPFALLATQLNHLIEMKKLEKFTILKLNKYVCHPIVSNKKVIICLEVEPLIPGSVVNYQIFATQETTSVEDTENACKAESIQNILPVVDNYHSPKKNSSTIHNIILNSITNQPSISNASLNSEHSSKNNVIYVNNQSNNSSFNHNWDTQASTNAGNANQSNIIPIASLSPYQNKWTIKARIIYKTSIKSYNNAKGSGKFFSFYLLDETGEIRVTAFNDLAESLLIFLVLNNVYYVSNAKVQRAKDNSAVKNDFEIVVNTNTNIELASDISSVPCMKFDFVPISQIHLLPKDSYVDIIGVCCYVSEMTTIVTKTNKEVYKLDLLLLDFDKQPMTLSLWGSDAEDYKCGDNHVIVVRRAKVTSFKGCSLTVSPDSMFFIDPPIKEASALKSWYEHLGDTFDIKLGTSDAFKEWNSQPWKICSEINAINFEDSDRAEYFTIKATITEVQKEKCMYQSCPISDCYKKVVDLGNGFYKCAKCDKEYDSFKWLLLLSFNLADFSDSLWAVAFREIAEIIIGYKVDFLSNAKEHDENKYLNILSNLHFQSFIFKLRSKMEIFNETSRLKTTVLDARPVDPIFHARRLLHDINRMEKILRVN
ncbi:replication protein A 70 kDa DNA-binding subunit-like [Argiope bruennichi]|uniref:replication protein A 70 kDa DNA-binding subunit-like n=1 Tax=Argiope bruennichi TaxID=94029 RepID=UPI002494A9B7|nr:replication protein A 70 kDa DNA-binding subunit-like [Argiope bruennichi]